MRLKREPATTDADKKAGFKKIAEEVNLQLPFVTYGATEEYNIPSRPSCRVR